MSEQTTPTVLPRSHVDVPMPSGVMPPRTDMDAADIEAMQLIRAAASVAVTSGALQPQFRMRVEAAAERVTAIIQREAARAKAR